MYPCPYLAGRVGCHFHDKNGRRMGLMLQLSRCAVVYRNNIGCAIIIFQSWTGAPGFNFKHDSLIQL